MRTLGLAGAIFALLFAGGPPEAEALATEARARATAEQNRAERHRVEAETGQPVAVIHDYIAHFVQPVPDDLDVSPFYQKYVDANGIPVLASSKVPDAALLVVRDIINSMLAWRGDLRESMIRRGWRTGVIAETEMTMDIPEYANRKRPNAPRGEPVMQADRDYHANRSRGLGGNPTTGAEEQWWFHSNYGECLSTENGGWVEVESPEQFAAYDSALFELLGRVFKSHRIPADIFHARQIRPVTDCPGA